jgi:hypothetical protein
MLTLIARFLPSLLPAAYSLLNPWVLLVIASVLGLAWFKGYQTGAGKLEAYRTEQFTAATKINAQRAAVTEKVVTRYIEVAGATQVRTEFIEREVADYAEQNPAGLCLDADWRRLHDRAALNTVSGPTGSPAGALRTPAAAGQGLGITDRR